MSQRELKGLTAPAVPALSVFIHLRLVGVVSSLVVVANSGNEKIRYGEKKGSCLFQLLIVQSTPCTYLFFDGNACNCRRNPSVYVL